MDRAELRRLMGRLADGDRAAFGPVFELLWPQLRAFAVRCVGADGEDAAQAALLKVFARASEYDRERDPLPWALGFAAWECRTLLRRRERRREESVAEALEHAGDAAELSPAPSISPEALVIDRDLLAAAAEVLGTLRPIDVETIQSIGSGRRSVEGATFRKRAERALARFRLAWRDRHGAD